MTRIFTLIPLLCLGLACADGAHLEPGVAVTHSIEVSQSREHGIPLQAGDFVELSLDQEGENLALVLEDPEGHRLLEVDTPNGPFGRERLYAVAEVSGEYRVGVETVGYVGGAYTLRAEVQRASEEDRRRALACRLLYESWLAGDSSSEARIAGEQALALWEDLEDPYLVAVALLRLGRFHQAIEEYDVAEERLRQALERSASLETRDLEPEVLVQLGHVLSRTRTDLAREVYEQAVTASREQRDRWHEGAAFNGLGVLLYQTRRQPWLTLGLFDQAVDIFREMNDLKSRADAHFNRGLVLNWLGRERPALDEYEKALDLRKQRELEGWDLSEILLEIGWAEMWIGEDRKAEAHMHQALELVQEEGPWPRAVCLDRLGTLYRRRGRPEEARDFHLAAIQGFEEAGDRGSRAHALSNLGRDYGELGEHERALEMLDEAESYFGQKGERSGVAQALTNRAHVLRREGELHAARASIDRALRLLEKLRDETRSPGLRSAYLETVFEPFELHVDILMALEEAEPAQGWAHRAIEAVERGRARSLLDLVAELGADRQRKLGPRISSMERTALQREIEKLELEVRALQLTRADREEIEEKSRLLRERILDLEYWDGIEPTPMAEPRSLDEIREALDPGTSFLMYSLGENRSFAWLLDPEGLIAWKSLDSREKIAERIRPLVQTLRSPVQVPLDLARIEQELGELGRDLLPAAALSRRVVVIPDGALHLLPFGALRVDDRYLIEDHEVSRLPSASVLVALRERRQRRPPAPQALALLADPVFDPTDPRFTAEAADIARLSRQDEPSGLAFLTRLPKSGEEADKLASLVAEDCRPEVRGFDATPESLRDGRLTSASLLHLATHALLDDKKPELSQVVLSQFDREGRARNGSLYAFEIADLELPADLVVLSACQTALGLEIRGEGLVGLPQGFFEAGADRVVVSLWNVDDNATAALMGHFYEGLLQQRRSPADALRHAQDLLRRSENFGAPYHWAAFTLIGDWRALPSTLLDSSCLPP